MSKKDKLLSRLESIPKDFTWEELVAVLKKHGFKESTNDGSRRCFTHISGEKRLRLHKPHPSNICKTYVLRQVLEALNEMKSQ